MRLHKRRPDNTTLHQHLQAAAEATGQADPLLQHQVPAAGAALWEAFVELNASRQAGMGANPILHSELEAWGRLAGVQLTPWEADTLRAMDRAALAVLHEAQPGAAATGASA